MYLRTVFSLLLLCPSLALAVPVSSPVGGAPAAAPADPSVPLSTPEPQHLFPFLKADSFPSHLKKAVALLEDGNTEAFELELRKVPTRSKRYEWVEALRGVERLVAKDTAGAQSAIDRALRLRGSDSDILYLKGVLLLERQAWNDALQAFQEAQWFGKLTVIPAGEVHYGRGVALGWLGRLPAATDALSSALTASPPSALAASALTTISLAKGDRPGAIRYARLSVEQHPEDPRSSTQLVQALLLKADPILDRPSIAEAEKATESLMKQVKDIDSDQGLDREILSLRIRALLAAQKPAAAEKIIAPLARKHPSDQALQRLARQVEIEKSAQPS